MPMSKVVETVSRKPLAPHVKALVFELCCNDADGEVIINILLDFLFQ